MATVTARYPGLLVMYCGNVLFGHAGCILHFTHITIYLRSIHELYPYSRQWNDSSVTRHCNVVRVSTGGPGASCRRKASIPRPKQRRFKFLRMACATFAILALSSNVIEINMTSRRSFPSSIHCAIMPLCINVNELARGSARA